MTADRVPAHEIAHRRGGHASGDGFLIRCPVPSHGKGRGDRSPSCLLKDGAAALLVKCFAGCDPTDILAALRADGDIPERDAPQRRRHRAAPAVPIADLDHLLLTPHGPSLAIWRGAGPAAGDTLTARYLRSRAIDGEVPVSIRHHQNVVYPYSGLMLPAMVAAISAPDRRIVAVHLTFLDPRGRGKARVSKPKLFPAGARIGGGAVRLATATDHVGLGEGIEDALSAMRITGTPTWAALGCARFASIDLPADVTSVSLFAQNDKPSRDAADRAADRFTSEGGSVLIRRPPEKFKDWNAWHQAGAPEC